jgi:uncharacterized PurR-regulated membrane protein YhhQ (DUF165 family)
MPGFSLQDYLITLLLAAGMLLLGYLLVRFGVVLERKKKAAITITVLAMMGWIALGSLVVYMIGQNTDYLQAVVGILKTPA